MASVIHMLKGILESDISGFARNMNKAAGGVDQLAMKWKEAGQAISRAATRVTVAATAMATAVVVKFAQFESTMTAAGAVTRTLGTKDFPLLEAAARKMGETTVFSATQAAEAIEVMGLAGLKTNEIIEALPGALQLAAAGSVDIATAASVAAKTMRAFGADAEELTHINDVLVGTFTRSNTDILQLSEAMKHVAPVSKALGVSLEDTSAIIAKMSDAGFQGSIAGTSLRNIMSRLAGAVPEATSKLRSLGVETLDSAGKMRPLLDILDDIESHGLTEADLLQIFGARGGPQLLAIMEAGVPTIREFSEELDNMGGIAQEVADAKLNTLSGAWKLFVSQIESFMIDAGKDVAPMLRMLAENMQAFLTANRADIIASMTAAIQGLAKALQTVVTRVGPSLVLFSSEFAKMLGWVLEFIAQHPLLLKALIAVKVAGFLGLASAAKALIIALGSTALAFAGVGTAATGAATAITAGGTAAAAAAPKWALLFGPGGIILAGVAATAALVLKLKELDDAREALTKASNESAKDMTISTDATGDRRKAALTGAGKRNREQVNKAEDTILAGGPLSDIGRQIENVERIEGMARRSRGPGAKEQEAGARETSANLRRDIARGVDFRLKKIEERLTGKGATPDQLGEFFADGIKQQRGEITEAIRTTGSPLVVAEAADKFLKSAEEAATAFESRMQPVWAAQKQAAIDSGIEQQLAVQKMAAREEAAGPEFGRISELMNQTGISEAAVKKIGESIQGGTPEATADLVGQFSVLKEAGELTKENLDFAVLVTLESIKKAKDAAAKAKEAAEQAEAANEQINKMQDAISEANLSDEQKTGFTDKLFGLQDQLANGAITVDQFAKSMQDLGGAINEAVIASEKKKLQEQREALLKGDFKGAGLNVQKAVQDRLAAFRMSQFNQQVDQAWQKFAKVNNLLPNVSQGFQNLKTGMDKFGQGMQKAVSNIAQNVDPRQIGEGLSRLGSFLNSQDGLIATIRNNIQLLQQTLPVLDTARQRMNVQNQIGALIGRLNEILQPRAPILTGLNSLRDVFRDPGLQASAGGSNLTVNFSSVAKPTPDDQRQIVDAVEAELHRRGFR